MISPKYNIDMSKSFSIGDTKRDIVAAENAGVGKNYLITKGIDIKSIYERV